MFKDKMVTTAIPERIFALCKMVEKGSISSSELKEKMEPDFLGNGSVYFNDYKNAAEELGIITISDDVITLGLEPQEIKTIEDMRAYINGRLENYKDGQFYLVTKAYFDKGSDIFREDKNIANLGPVFTQMTNYPIDAVAMRAWRFWASFLGFGYLQEMFIIPNAYIFLGDVIKNSPLEKKHMYPINEFLEKISPMNNIIIDMESGNKTFNYGVSNGLRALQDAGKIKMEHIMDQKDMWNLYPLKAYSNDAIVTHITIN